MSFDSSCTSLYLYLDCVATYQSQIDPIQYKYTNVSSVWKHKIEIDRVYNANVCALCALCVCYTVHVFNCEWHVIVSALVIFFFYFYSFYFLWIGKVLNNMIEVCETATKIKKKSRETRECHKVRVKRLKVFKFQSHCKFTSLTKLKYFVHLYVDLSVARSLAHTRTPFFDCICMPSIAIRISQTNDSRIGSFRFNSNAWEITRKQLKSAIVVMIEKGGISIVNYSYTLTVLKIALKSRLRSMHNQWYILSLLNERSMFVLLQHLKPQAMWTAEYNANHRCANFNANHGIIVWQNIL